MNFECIYEQRVLSRCAKGDDTAIQEFDNRSYLNAILIAVDETHSQLGCPLNSEELEKVCVILVGKVYEESRTLPSWREDLKARLAKYIPQAFFTLVKSFRDE